MAPAAYLQRYHGPVTEASAPAQMVSSVREAVQSVSASPSLHKAAENRPKLQPTWHSQRHHSIDKERKPLSLPTPPHSSTCLSSFMSWNVMDDMENLFLYTFVLFLLCYSHLCTYPKTTFHQGWFSSSHHNPKVVLFPSLSLPLPSPFLSLPSPPLPSPSLLLPFSFPPLLLHSPPLLLPSPSPSPLPPSSLLACSSSLLVSNEYVGCV